MVYNGERCSAEAYAKIIATRNQKLQKLLKMVETASANGLILKSLKKD
jgi:hypothetical protein